MIHDQMGLPIDDEEVPLDIEDLSYNSQQALLLFNILPDKIEGMNGVWLGKEYAGLSDIMDIYEIDSRRDVLDLLQICINIFFFIKKNFLSYSSFIVKGIEVIFNIYIHEN